MEMPNGKASIPVFQSVLVWRLRRNRLGVASLASVSPPNVFVLDISIFVEVHCNSWLQTLLSESFHVLN